VQGLTALEYSKFTTFEGSAAGLRVLATGWKTAVNRDSVGSMAKRGAKAWSQYLGDQYAPFEEFSSNHLLGYSRSIEVGYLGNGKSS